MGLAFPDRQNDLRANVVRFACVERWHRFARTKWPRFALFTPPVNVFE
jgi:hypothetical protein